MGLLFLAAMVLFGQCSKYTGKSLLTFFFDGVPEEDSLALQSQEPNVVSGDSALLASSVLDSEPGMRVHYPYAERECGACHDPQSLGSMVEPQPGLCYMCHEDLSTQFDYLHGPVAGGYCTSCHDPHMSENEHLIRIIGDELCFHCHNEERLASNEMHMDLDGMQCADCHNAHGGDDKYIFQ